MQGRSFEPWIFGFTADVDAWSGWSTLRIIVVYALFITSHGMMQKKLSFATAETAVHTWQNIIRRLLASTRTASNILTFKSFLKLSNVPKLLYDQLLMILLVQLAPDMSLHEVMPLILRLQTFSVRQRVIYLQHQNHYFWSV